MKKTIFLLLCLVPSTPLQAAPQFSITNLNRLLPADGFPNGFENGDATGISESGQAVGSGQYQNGISNFFPFLYQSPTVTQLSPPNGFDGATAISRDGTKIVGSIGFEASIYAGSGTWNSLGNGTFVYGVNDSATAVGETYDEDSGSFHATSYSGGAAHDLGTLGGSGSVANGINNPGQMVGNSDTAEGGQHAFVYEGGIMVDLGSFDSGDSSVYSSATAINEQGDIVGYSETVGDYYRHAALWVGGAEGVIQDLGVVDGFLESEAKDINGLGQVVGSLDRFDGAFYFDGTTMWNLQDLIVDLAGSGIFSLRGAYGINDQGQITGTGYDQDGNQVAFVLTGVPEPSTWGLLVVGLAMLGFARFRRTKLSV